MTIEVLRRGLRVGLAGARPSRATQPAEACAAAARSSSASTSATLIFGETLSSPLAVGVFVDIGGKPSLRRRGGREAAGCSIGSAGDTPAMTRPRTEAVIIE